MNTPHTTAFLTLLNDYSPVFAKHVLATSKSPGFYPLAERLISYANSVLGETTSRRLVDGYITFVMDVNRAQANFERDGRYLYSSYAEIKREVYDDVEYMHDYHWGMFTTIFCWQHHFQITRFYQLNFLPRLLSIKNLHFLDLGCGSGVWSLLALDALPDATATLVDITPTTIRETQKMLDAALLHERCQLVHANAVDYSAKDQSDAVISCFLAAHLEDPQAYFHTIAHSLKPGGISFIVVALTAAESDHIQLFNNESKIIAMAETAGLRLLAADSASPVIKSNSRYLPRALALILEKKSGEHW